MGQQGVSKSWLHKKATSIRSSSTNFVPIVIRIEFPLGIFFLLRLTVFIDQFTLQLKRHRRVFMKPAFEFCTSLGNGTKRRRITIHFCQWYFSNYFLKMPFAVDAFHDGAAALKISHY